MTDLETRIAAEVLRAYESTFPKPATVEVHVTDEGREVVETFVWVEVDE